MLLVNIIVKLATILLLHSTCKLHLASM